MISSNRSSGMRFASVNITVFGLTNPDVNLKGMHQLLNVPLLSTVMSIVTESLSSHDIDVDIKAMLIRTENMSMRRQTRN